MDNPPSYLEAIRMLPVSAIRTTGSQSPPPAFECVPPNRRVEPVEFIVLPSSPPLQYVPPRISSFERGPFPTRQPENNNPPTRLPPDFIVPTHLPFEYSTHSAHPRSEYVSQRRVRPPLEILPSSPARHSIEPIPSPAIPTQRFDPSLVHPTLTRDTALAWPPLEFVAPTRPPFEYVSPSSSPTIELTDPARSTLQYSPSSGRPSLICELSPIRDPLEFVAPTRPPFQYVSPPASPTIDVPTPARPPFGIDARPVFEFEPRPPLEFEASRPPLEFDVRPPFYSDEGPPFGSDVRPPFGSDVRPLIGSDVRPPSRSDEQPPFGFYAGTAVYVSPSVPVRLPNGERPQRDRSSIPSLDSLLDGIPEILYFTFSKEDTNILLICNIRHSLVFKGTISGNRVVILQTADRKAFLKIVGSSIPVGTGPNRHSRQNYHSQRFQVSHHGNHLGKIEIEESETNDVYITNLYDNYDYRSGTITTGADTEIAIAKRGNFSPFCYATVSMENVPNGITYGNHDFRDVGSAVKARIEFGESSHTEIDQSLAMATVISYMLTRKLMGVKSDKDVLKTRQSTKPFAWACAVFVFILFLLWILLDGPEIPRRQSSGPYPFRST